MAGFVGVILVLRDERTSAVLHSNQIFHLLVGSLGVCGAALLPLIVQSAFSEEGTVWRLCTPVVGLAHLLGATKGINDLRKGELGLSVASIIVFAPISYLLAGACAVIASGYCVERAPAVYLVALGWGLVVAATTFLAVIFRQEHRSNA